MEPWLMHDRVSRRHDSLHAFFRIVRWQSVTTTVDSQPPSKAHVNLSSRGPWPLKKAMASLRERIQSVRRRNIDSKWFIPAGTVNDVLSLEEVKNELKEIGVPAYRQKEIAGLITQGGRRTFATLVLIRRQNLIMRFVESDQLLNVPLDSRLPFGMATLESLLPSADRVDFFERQWELTSPIFGLRQGHRQLDDDTILPFLETRPIGEGGFGFVAEVRLHPRHGRSTTSSFEQVRRCLVVSSIADGKMIGPHSKKRAQRT